MISVRPRAARLDLAGLKSRGRGGRSVVCGVQTAEDCPVAAVAGALADALAVPLVLVHVLPPLRPAGAMMAMAMIPLPGIDDQPHGRAVIAHVRAGAAVCPARAHVVRGVAGPALVDVARSERAAVLVIGASSRSRLARALLGSTSGHVVRAAGRPVFVASRDVSTAMAWRDAFAGAQGPRRR